MGFAGKNITICDVRSHISNSWFGQGQLVQINDYKINFIGVIGASRIHLIYFI